MKSTHMISTPATGLSSFVARERSCEAPNLAAQGTAVSFAGLVARPMAAAQAVLADVRSTDLTGLVPRGAPV